MNHRRFQDAAVSEIGLGTWQLGSSDWGTVDEVRANEILQRFVDEGGNFIDTADVYGMGTSEKVIGKFLKNVKNQVFVATKLGRRQDNGYGWPQNFTYGNMRRQVEDSLFHLNISEIFLEQLHCIPEDELRAGHVFDHLRRLRQEGLIRHWGVSVETVDEALLCLEQEGIASLQIIFNLFRQHLAEQIFNKAAEKQVAIIVRVPLASGLLSGKFTRQTVFRESDHRNYNAEGTFFNVGETFSGIDFKKGVGFAETIGSMLPPGQMPQWALRWILDHDNVTTVIPGASSPDQVTQNMQASSLPPLSEDIHRSLRKLYDDNIYNEIRGRF